MEARNADASTRHDHPWHAMSDIFEWSGSRPPRDWPESAIPRSSLHWPYPPDSREAWADLTPEEEAVALRAMAVIELLADCAAAAPDAWSWGDGEWLAEQLAEQFRVDLQQHRQRRQYHGRTRRPIPPGRRLAVYERDSFTCVSCERSGTDVTLSLDHIVPHSRGGGDGLDNLQTMCQSCNSSKGDRV